MATKLHSFPAGLLGNYEWDEWLDGGVWELTRGHDFHQSPANFRTYAHQCANRHRLKVRTRIEGDSVFIQAYSPNGNGSVA